TTLQIVGPLPEFNHLIKGALTLLLLGAIGGIVITLVLVRKETARAEALTHHSGPSRGASESPDNDQYFKWGMFYYNPQDPAVVVEKRFGVGMTLNFATWQGKLFAALIIATLLVGLTLPFIVQ
ncbi:MAG: DUF5808 domain-containing protein, partial [Corynebacterium sp.]|nr:DUF5808 domain-containing protein [Corynebacterium sp.]